MTTNPPTKSIIISLLAGIFTLGMIFATITIIIPALNKPTTFEAVQDQTKTPAPPTVIPTPTPSNMNITSPAFAQQQFIPAKYTCDGDNTSPPLNFDKIPQYTLSLVLIVDDPDAPAGDWVHWLLWNISPQARHIPENSVPQGATQGKTDFGKTQYGGPCPPLGTHRYQFKLYALDIKLQLDPSATKPTLESAIQDHILEQAILTGLYKRQ